MSTGSASERLGDETARGKPLTSRKQGDSSQLLLWSVGVGEQFREGVFGRPRRISEDGSAARERLGRRLGRLLDHLAGLCRSPVLSEAALEAAEAGLSSLSQALSSEVDLSHALGVSRERYEARSKAKFSKSNGGQGGI